MKHIRVYAKLGFWSPCILAKDLSESEVQTYEGIESALAMFFPIINNVISIEVTDVATAASNPATTLSDVTASS